MVLTLLGGLLRLEVNWICWEPAAPYPTPERPGCDEIGRWTIQVKGASIVMVGATRGRRRTDAHTMTDSIVGVTAAPIALPGAIQLRLLVNRTVGARDVQRGEVTDQVQGARPHEGL